MDNRTTIAIASAGWAVAGLLGGVMLAGGRLGGGDGAGRKTAPPNPFWVSKVASAEGAAAGATPGVTLELAGVTTAEAFVGRLAAALGKPVHPHWEHLPIGRETPVRFDVPIATVETAIRLLNSQLNDYETLDLRVYEGHAELGTAWYFDRQEIVAVNYDLGPVVRAIQGAADPVNSITADAAVQMIIRTIEENVAFDCWLDNGGDLARANLVGSGLLVSAPRRFHPQVAWVLEQIEKTPGWTTGLQRLLSPGLGGSRAGAGAGAGSGKGGGGAGPAAATPQ